MTTKVELYSVLRDITGVAELELDLPEGTTVGALLARLFELHPRLAGWSERLLLAANLDYVDRSHVVQGGEIISIMPPVQGG